MSRSRRKRPFCSVTVCGFRHGEHRDKKIASRKLRHRVRQVLRKFDLGVDHVFPVTRELSNRWTFRKDAKLRFNPLRNPECMRK